jgi:hypothetical protein
MASKTSNPAALACADRVRNSISLAAIDPEIIAERFALQFISRYRVPPSLAATIARLAGLGPKEARQ